MQPQSKNWILFSSLLSLVNSGEIEAEDITIKYFEPGHTFMSADHVHAGVEKEMHQRENGDVYNFSDFCEVVKDSNGGRVQLIQMQNDDFLKWEAQQSQAKLKKPDRPKLADVVEIRFCRGYKEMFYKESYTGMYTKFDFLKKNASLEIPGRIREAPRGIPAAKKQDIVTKLCPFMPETRRGFWEGLIVNDQAVDLIDMIE